MVRAMNSEFRMASSVASIAATNSGSSSESGTSAAGADTVEARAVEGVVGDISMQYILRYVPDADDIKAKVIRKIRVDIPDLPAGINVNYRKFYYPNPVPLGPAAGSASK